ncbi:hypothetical protein BH09BAC5_BH09BAC5_27940 [soil metagenome]
MRLWFIFLLTNFTTFLSAQGTAFTFYSVDQGLSQSTVMDIYKDPKGLLWVGTGEGLSLWNGYKFRNFKYHYDDPSGLSNNYVRHFLPDSFRSCVWVGTESGLDCFDKQGTKIINSIVYPEWASNDHIPLFVNKESLFVFITGKGIFKIDLKSRKYSLIRKDVFHFFQKIIQGTDLLCYQNFAKQWICIHLLTGKMTTEDLPTYDREFAFTEMIPWSSGYLLTSSNGLWCADKEGRNIRQVTQLNSNLVSSTDYFSALSKDSSGRIWFSVFGKGLFSCDESLNQIRPHYWQLNGESIAGKLVSIRKIICDAYNVIWIATDGEGLIRFNGNRLYFNTTFTETPVTDSTRWFIKSFCAEKNAIWIGTYLSGLKYVNYQTSELISYQTDLFRSINFIEKGKNNSLLLGTENGIFEFSNGNFIPYKIVPEFSLKATFHTGIRLHDGRCIAGSNQCIFLVNETTHTISPIENTIANFSCLTELANGDLLCSAKYRGLFIYNKQLILTRQIIFTSLGLPAATTITNFVSDNSGGLWASSNIGLLHFDSDFNLVEILTEKNGLPDNFLYGMVEITNQQLMISSGNGISIFNPANHTFHNFTTADGLRSNECNTRAIVFSPDSFLYVGGINGFVRKHFSSSEQPVKTPTYFIENFRINDLIFNNIDSLKKLNHTQNSISFELLSSDFAFSEMNYLQYRTDGLDTNRITIPAGFPIRLSSLSPGNYFLHIFIRSENKHEIFSLPFTVKPPWWQQTWFRILFIFVIVLFAGFIVYIIFAAQFKKKLRRIESLRMLEKVRTRISSDIHDDLGAGLTRIALTSDLVSLQLKENIVLHDKVGRMAEVARDLSQSLKEVVWSVKPEYDNFPSMINYFKAYCGEFFENSEITFTFHSTVQHPDKKVAPEIRRNLFLILKEALNNIIKHANADHVSVHIQLEGNIFEMIIEDNGIGFSLQACENKINSNGITNMKKRAEIIGMTSEFTNGELSGTKIIVKGTL